MIWRLSWRADPAGASLADRHYNRQRVGSKQFVDPTKVRGTNPGYCYLRAGFRRVGVTKGGLLAFQMLPAEMPPPAPALPRQRGEQLGLLAGEGDAA